MVFPILYATINYMPDWSMSLMNAILHLYQWKYFLRWCLYTETNIKSIQKY